MAKKKKNEGQEVIDVDAVQSNIFDTIPDNAILRIHDPVTEKIVLKIHTSVTKSLKIHIKIERVNYLIVLKNYLTIYFIYYQK